MLFKNVYIEMKGKCFDVAYNIDNWLNYMYIIQKQKVHKTVFFCAVCVHQLAKEARSPYYVGEK